MNVAYFGSPKLAAQLLDILHKKQDLHIKLVVTQPDRPAGKRLTITPTDVKTNAYAKSLEVFDKILDQETERQLEQLFHKHAIQLCIVFAYGAIISKQLLSSVKYGFWNIHPSLLPKYRGAAPIIFPLALGEKKTGVTLIAMNEHMDTGDIICQSPIEIHEDTTRIDVENMILHIASEMIVQNVQTIKTQKKLLVRTQDHTHATITRRITKEDGYLPLDILVHAQKSTKSMLQNDLPYLLSWYYTENSILHTRKLSSGQIVWNLYKALIGWPGIWTRVQTNKGFKRLQIKRISYNNKTIAIQNVQFEGKKEVTFMELNKSCNIFK
ncbi:MAG: Methionyl-tRNA formyltransferase [Candidatus Roizmanbacteria bacterium GW2011_GWA2_37_7]|uniref:methionyl-tRNA formyltransferase n=1 Tax=Candidatus Roizmanbacteria bacterium GW2011_GWA2_37_7 TaxID=1618481 RepID=A0A0G0HEY2_9BACT|nr:MAG: Methionyl-tRNA formyltransferase [Candidatus Roizmanbacteria bacterium GW2011_GWA2_37_7]